MHRDIIRVKDRLIHVSLASGSRWPAKTHQGVLQPVLVSVDLTTDVSPTATTDDLTKSINYSSIAKILGSAFDANQNKSPVVFRSIDELSNRAVEVVQGEIDNLGAAVTGISVKVLQVKAPLHCRDVAVQTWSSKEPSSTWKTSKMQYTISDFICPIIIGVNDVEREEKQDVVMNITIDIDCRDKAESLCLDFRQLTRLLWNDVGNSSYLTLEALASFVTEQTLHFCSKSLPPATVTVAAAKPCALVHASASEVQVTRMLDDFGPQISHSLASISSSLYTSSNQQVHGAVVTFGSNLGDRFRNIEYALRLLEVPSRFLLAGSGVKGEREQEDTPFVSIVDTSFLYETTPMYVTDQPSFINGACLIVTNLDPQELLRLVKAIEVEVGRTPTIRFGPRVVDLDIIFFDDLTYDTRPAEGRGCLDNLQGHLVIPHPRLREREFVLRPLNDIIPDYIHPQFGRKSIHTLLSQITRLENEPPMRKVIPFPTHPYSPPSDNPSMPPPTLTYWVHPSQSSVNNGSGRRPKVKTRLMATLNVTPDSFSDGSDHSTVPTALSYASRSVAAGVDIIDVGGYSTRPGAEFVSVEEEIRRVVSVIEGMRSMTDVGGSVDDQQEGVRNIPISVDTFRWEVADAAIRAGANCINDVYAFTGPASYSENKRWTEDEEVMARMEKMKQVARESAAVVVAMHSRGDAGKDKEYQKMYGYAEQNGGEAVIEGVMVELGDKVDGIVRGPAGVRRWLVIVDPGLGFSKSVEGNLRLLKNGKKIVEKMYIGDGSGSDKKRRRNPLAGFPTLIGPSRKSFLGSVLSASRGGDVAPKERIWATAAAVACAVQQGSLIVRVHDVQEMADVVAMADALWLVDP